MCTENLFPKIDKVKNGWSARGKGWAVHAQTKTEAIAKFEEREKFYRELAKRPPIYEVYLLHD